MEPGMDVMRGSWRLKVLVSIIMSIIRGHPKRGKTSPMPCTDVLYMLRSLVD